MGSLTSGSMDRNELEVIGGLLNEPLAVTSAETVDLPVPTLAEIVIEGVIDPNTIISDGPFAEYTKYYGGVMKESVFLIKVTAITMRRDAIYHDLNPGQREHNLANVLSEESRIYDVVKAAVPTVKAVHSPPSGSGSFTVYVSIKKRVQGEGKNAGLAAISATPEAGKIAIVVDDDIDIYDDEEVLWAIATRLVADLGISIIPRVTGAQLDPTSYDETRLGRGHMTSKVIIDATKPIGLPFAMMINPHSELWDSIKLEDYFSY
jgi:2,5-furandicarboxylate decarboxylase 1